MMTKSHQLNPRQLASASYVALTTYRRDGRSSAVPVWVAPVDAHTVAIATDAGSLKARRIVRDPRVLLQPCTFRGEVDPAYSPVQGQAVVVHQGEAAAYIRLVRKKYGIRFAAVNLLMRVTAIVTRHGGPLDTAIVVSCDRD